MKHISIKAKYKPLFQDTEQRYILLTGGRNSAKSFTAALAEAHALTLNIPHKTLFTRYTLSSAEISIIPEFQDKLTLAGWERNFSAAKNVIQHKTTGNSIIFSGIKTSSGNQTAKLKSIPGLSRFVVDEAEEFRDEAAFDTIDFSVRAVDAPNRVTIIMNPQDIDHFIWRKWFEGYAEYHHIDGTPIPISTHPEVLHIHSTYLNNLDNIPKSYFDKILHLRESNRPKYEHLFLGKWQEKAEGVVFPNWTEGAWDESLPYAYGLDYGYFPDPLALVRVAVDSSARKIYLHEEIYATELSTEETVRRVLSVAGRERMVIADTSEPRLSAAISAAGVNIQAADKGPDSVIDGIKKMQDYQIIVTPQSHNVKRELNTYTWNDKKSSTPIDANNHCFVGRTMIETLEGEKPIESINPGEYVKTSHGFNKVLKRWNNGKKLVQKYSIQFDTFSLSLICTDNHLIKTDQGWIQVSELKSGMTVYLSKSLMEKSTASIPANAIFHAARSACMLLFGNTIMGKCLVDSMCITKMKTHGITGRKIWNACPEGIIFLSTLKSASKKILNGLRSSTRQALQRLPNGTAAKKGGNGIESTEKKHGNPGNLLFAIAKSAARSTKRNTWEILNFAPIGAKAQLGENPALTMNFAPALSAEAHLAYPNIQEYKVAAVHVGKSSEQEVYDLTIENEHEYFANGVLVHNCMDAARYCYVRLAWGSDALAWV